MDMYNNVPWGMTPIQFNDNRQTVFNINSVGTINNGPVTNNHYYSHSEEKATTELRRNSSVEDKIAMCLEKLMLFTDGKNRIFKNQNHWMAVYRMMVDHQLGAVDGDYLGFCNYIHQIHPEPFAIELKHDSLKRIAGEVYAKPRYEWKLGKTYTATRTPFDQMCMVAATFERLLKEYGLIS